MTDSPATTYFDLARSWADEREASNARRSRVAWTIAALACGVAALEAVALALAMPLKRVEPIAVLVDRTTGHVERVDLDDPAPLTANAALQRSLLAQYVVARESYDPIGVRDAYRRVMLWSADQASASYAATMRQNPPSAALARNRGEIGLVARVKSISMLGPQSALVRFDVARLGGDGRQTATRPYVATISFNFVERPMEEADRLTNPLGFQVRSYRVAAEALPTDPDAAPAPSPPGTAAASGDPA